MDIGFNFNKEKLKEEDISVEKLKKHVITKIKGTDDKELASILKKKLSCGGSTKKKENCIILQGDQKISCIQILRRLDYL